MLEEETRRQSYGMTSYDRRSEPNEKKSTMTFFFDHDIEVATNGFSESHKIREEGYYWRVYRGYLHDTDVAIMLWDADKREYTDVGEFLQELEALGQMRHPNVVKLIGACVSLRSLVFEFLPNGNIEDCLSENPSILTWQVRTRIVYEIRSAFVFLHSKKSGPFIHGVIKPSNIFLDASFRSKLSVIGLASAASSYMDLEFLKTGRLTTTCDLYSYGLTVLRILTGNWPPAGIVREVGIAYKNKSLMKIVDPTAGNWPPHVSELLARLGLKCCREDGERNLGTMEEIMKELRDFLAATDNYFINKDSRYLSSSTSTSSCVKVFLYSDIERATKGFRESLQIGKGAYGSVYKGCLDDNTEVAIKVLDATSSEQGSEEFNQELEVLVQMRHPNLVKLIGACFKNHSLVYEFLPKGSLEDCLKNSPTLLTWQVRTRVVYEICSALIFLHKNKPQPLLHGDLKPANILLDGNFHVKLSDFGLCRFLPEGTDTKKFHKTKNFRGTKWYVDPDYLETGNLSPGCDVYSFGITILRILTRASPIQIFGKVYREYYVKKSLMTMVDSTAGTWPRDVAEYLACNGLRCCEPEGRSRSELMMEISSGLKNILAEIHSRTGNVSSLESIRQKILRARIGT